MKQGTTTYANLDGEDNYGQSCCCPVRIPEPTYNVLGPEQQSVLWTRLERNNPIYALHKGMQMLDAIIVMK